MGVLTVVSFQVVPVASVGLAPMAQAADTAHAVAKAPRRASTRGLDASAREKVQAARKVTKRAERAEARAESHDAYLAQMAAKAPAWTPEPPAPDAPLADSVAWELYASGMEQAWIIADPRCDDVRMVCRKAGFELVQRSACVVLVYARVTKATPEAEIIAELRRYAMALGLGKWAVSLVDDVRVRPHIVVVSEAEVAPKAETRKPGEYAAPERVVLVSDAVRAHRIRVIKETAKIFRDRIRSLGPDEYLTEEGKIQIRRLMQAKVQASEETVCGWMQTKLIIR